MDIRNSSLTIRVMTRAELDIAIEWAALEGWNPGLNDAACFYSADPDGFLIGLLDDVPVATISAVRYSDRAGFIGLYIVSPEYRGKGFGMQIWNAGLAYLQNCNIGLDGVVAQQQNYQKSGFQPAYQNIRYQGIGGGKSLQNQEIVLLTEISFDELCIYDRLFFPGNRTAFLKCWINQPDGRALGILRSGKLAGYGVIRSCRSGYKLGPLFADKPEYAHQLFTALSAYAPSGSLIYLDIPGVNPAATELVTRHHMTPCFETARMYTGEFPDMPMCRIFGITSFELG